MTIKENEIIVSVKKSSTAVKTFSRIVGKIEILFNEWFPSLLIKDAFGIQQVIRVALCEKCGHKFDIEILEESTTERNSILCPGHDDYVIIIFFLFKRLFSNTNAICNLLLF